MTWQPLESPLVARPGRRFYRLRKALLGFRALSRQAQLIEI